MNTPLEIYQYPDLKQPYCWIPKKYGGDEIISSIKRAEVLRYTPSKKYVDIKLYYSYSISYVNYKRVDEVKTFRKIHVSRLWQLLQSKYKKYE